MKKAARLFILLMVMTGSRVMAWPLVAPGMTAQNAPPGAAPITQGPTTSTAPGGASPTASGVSTPVAPGAAGSPSRPVSQTTPGIPILYFSMGAGTAFIDNGFGTEGNPWIDTNTDTLANGYGASFNPSEAFVALVGFNLDKNWSLDLSLENYSFTTIQSSASNEVNVIPALRYTFNSDWIAPYVSAGLGFNFNTTSAVAPVSIISVDGSAQAAYNTQVDSNIVASGGVGLMLAIAGNQGHFFVEGQFEQVFTAQGGFSFYPLTIGFQYP